MKKMILVSAMLFLMITGYGQTSPLLKFETGKVSAVGEDYVTVTLDHHYIKPVIVTSIQYVNNKKPVISRITGITENSFDLRLQNPGDLAHVKSETVYYFVVEEGVWELPDGRKMEAKRIISTTTDRKNFWNGEIQPYGQLYENPVVLGQVMSENDTHFSVFWSSGMQRNKPPSSENLTVGKHVARDNIISRENEEIGYIVLEAGEGEIEGVKYEVNVGKEKKVGNTIRRVATVRGVGDNPPYKYPFKNMYDQKPGVSIVSQSGMRNSRGSWVYLYKGNAIKKRSLGLVVDSEQIKHKNKKRKLSKERVAYWVFEESVSFIENEPPAIAVLSPNGTGNNADTSFAITWEDTDPDDNAQVSFFYDTDSIGADGTLINTSPISEDDETDTYLWNTTLVAEGTYYIYALINDGKNTPVIAYSDGTVTIDHLPEIGLKQDTMAIASSGVYDFGEMGTNTSLDITFTIENTGTDDLILNSAPIITITGTNASDFSVVSQPISPISASESSTFIIRFEPTTSGVKNAQVVINNNDSDEGVYVLNLVGTANKAPFITLTEPNGIDDIADTGFTITWEDADPDDDARISFFYDTDSTEADGTLINTIPISEDNGENSYLWNTTLVEAGSYYVYAVIDDGKNIPLTVYSEGRITVDHNAPPFIQLLQPNGIGDEAREQFTITWSDSDVDNNASIALYYDIDNSGENGSLIVDGLSEDDTSDSIVWSTSSLPAGDYYVYAVIDDGVNAPFTAYSSGTVTINHSAPDFSLTWEVQPAEAGGITPASGSLFESGEQVQIRVTAAEGYVFEQWLSGASGANPDINLTMTDSTHLIAKFSPAPTSLLTNTQVDVFFHLDELSNQVDYLQGVFTTTGNTPEERVEGFITTHKMALQYPDVMGELAYEIAEETVGGSVVSIEQRFNGIPVLGGSMTAELDGEGNIVTLIGSPLNLENVTTTPAISGQTAFNSALVDLGVSGAALEEVQLIIINLEKLTGKVADDITQLAYKVTLSHGNDPGTSIYFVDAQTAGVIYSYNNLHTAVEPHIYTVGNDFTLPGTLLKSPGYEDPLFSSNADAVLLAQHLDEVTTYFSLAHNLDDLGSAGNTTLEASVDYGAIGANLAFWTGGQIGFSTGYVGLDLAAHEYTHAIIDNRTELIYAEQPGALNESLSDVFAALIDDADWTIGEGLPGGILRSLENPKLYGQPDYISDFVETSSDNGGVHDNSGILNKAAYLIANGGTHRQVVVAGIGREKLGKLCYSALASLLPTTNFVEFRWMMEAAARKLYGETSQELITVKTAFAAVGIGVPLEMMSPPPDTLPTGLTGTETTVTLEEPGNEFSWQGAEAFCGYRVAYGSGGVVSWPVGGPYYNTQVTFPTPNLNFPQGGYEIARETYVSVNSVANGLGNVEIGGGHYIPGIHLVDQSPFIGTMLAQPNFTVRYAHLTGVNPTNYQAVINGGIQVSFFRLSEPHQVVLSSAWTNGWNPYFAGTSPTVALEWIVDTELAPYLTGYELQVSINDPTFASENLLIDINNLPNNASGYNLTFPSPYNQGIVYWWRIRAVGGSCYDTSYGAWSISRPFTILPEALQAPVLIAPTDGSYQSGTDITFQWNTFEPVNINQLQIATDAGFSNTIYDETFNISGTGTATLPLTGFPDDETVYYWRVLSAVDNGYGYVSGPSSEIWSFINGTETSDAEINLKQGTVDIFSGETYDFGNITENTTTDVIFTIENTGTDDLILNNNPIITIMGGNAGDFSVTQQPTSPVNDGNSTNFTIRFEPASTGVKNAQVVIDNNDSDEGAYVLNLTGISIPDPCDPMVTSYSWNGSTSTDWNTATNWTPNGVPCEKDNVTIDVDGNNAPNNPSLPPSGVSVGDFTIISGTLDLSEETLTITGVVSVNGGLIDNGTLNLATIQNATFTNATVGGIVIGNSGNLVITNSIFNRSVTFSAPNITTVGGTFNGVATITKTGSGSDISYNNTFSEDLLLINTSTGNILFADRYDTDLYHGNVTVENESSGGIYFGNSGGISTLASGQTLSIGSSGFTDGVLYIGNLTQEGITPQSIVLSSANLILQNTNWGGDVTFSAPNITTVGGTFNGVATITKTGSGSDISYNNTFSEDLLLINTSTGNILFADRYDTDLYHGNVTVENTSLGGIYFGNSGGISTLASGQTLSIGSSGFTDGVLYIGNLTQEGITPQSIVLSSANLILQNTNWGGDVTFSAPNITTVGGTFNGVATITKTGSGSDISYNNTFSEDLLLINTSTGNILFADRYDTDLYHGNVTVENTSLGGIYFGNSGGISTLASGQTLSIGSSGFTDGVLYIGNLTQEGITPQSIVLSSANLILQNTNWGGDVTFSAPNITTVGGTFNGVATITKTGSGSDISYNNTFSEDLLLINTSTGNILFADRYDTDLYHGNVTVENTSLGGIYFGNSGGISTLASGQTLSIGSSGFTDGVLYIGNLTQEGITPQSIVLSSANLILQNTNWGGDVTFSAPNITTVGGTFNGVATITKTGSGSDISYNNTFSEDLLLINTSTGNILFADRYDTDLYHGNVTVENESSGGIYFGNSGGISTLASGQTLSIGSSGFTDGVLYIGNLTQEGITPQSIVLSSANLILQNTNWGGDVTFSAPNITTVGGTFNGVATITKTGSGSDISYNNTFSEDLLLINTSTGNILFADRYDTDLYHGNVTVENTSLGGIYFGNSGGVVELAGTANQVLAGNIPFSINQLDLSSGTGTVILQQSVNLSVLILDDRILDLNSNTINLMNPSSTAITSTTGFIISEDTDHSSKLAWNIGTSLGEYTFPFGKADGTRIPLVFDHTSGDVGNVTVSTYQTDLNNTPFPATVTNLDNTGNTNDGTNIIDRFWQMNASGAGTATLTFTYADNEVTGSVNESDLEAQWYETSTDQWQAPLVGQTQDVVANTVTVPSVTDLSDWVLSSGNVASISAKTNPRLYTVKNKAITTTRESEMVETLQVYPNPSPGVIHVKWPQMAEGETSLLIYNAMGKLVLNKPFIDRSGGSVDLKGFGGGVYLLKVVINGEMKTKKIIIE